MISPVWFRPAVGQLFRGGIAYNCYLKQIALYRLFHERPGDVGILIGAWKSRRATAVNESLLDVDDDCGSETVKVVFNKMEFSFQPLDGWNDYLLEELKLITRPRYLEFADSIGDVPIGINIRCGNDFAKAPDDPDYTRVGWLQKTPVSWFCETLEMIRIAAGHPVRAVVVSDGTEESLRDILAMKNVTFLRPGTAITDLLVLARSKVLLASATSTFSAWACYLGQMPTANAPGHPLTNWGISNKRGQYIGDFNPRKPTHEFIRQAAEACRVAS